MDLQIHLIPEAAESLRAKAAQAGQPPEEYAAELLQSILAPATEPPQLSDEEWERAFAEAEAFFASLPQAPVIPLEALRRENLYEDRGR